ncbi:hypothetical protein vseg_016985 [Gypsophila vaccaria]
MGDLPARYLRHWSNMMAVKDEESDSYSTKIYFQMEIGGRKYTFLENFGYSMTITSKGSEILYVKILKVFRVIDFSSNNFTGKIPDVIGKLNGLQALNLSNNNLDGRIPTSVANMTDLESLDLSRNMLFGEIPQQLPQLTSLEVFDVSYNQLEGPIPQGNQFDTFLSSSYQGNSRLCASPLSTNCQNADASAPSTIMENNNAPNQDYYSSFIDWIVRSFGCVTGFIIGIVIGKLYITDKYHEWFMETFQPRPKRTLQSATRTRLRRRNRF